MRNENELDKLFREQLSGAEETPPMHLWPAVSKATSKKNKGGWIIGFIALGILAALVVKLIVSEHDTTNHHNTTSEVETSNQPSSNNEKTVFAKNSAQSMLPDQAIDAPNNLSNASKADEKLATKDTTTSNNANGKQSNNKTKTVHGTFARPNSNPTSSNPTTSNPTSSNTSSSNPSSSNPSSSNPSSSNLSSSNLSPINPTSSNPSTSNPSTSNPSTSNLSSSNLSPSNVSPSNVSPINPLPANLLNTTIPDLAKIGLVEYKTPKIHALKCYTAEAYGMVGQSGRQFLKKGTAEQIAFGNQTDHKMVYGGGIALKASFKPWLNLSVGAEYLTHSEIQKFQTASSTSTYLFDTTWVMDPYDSSIFIPVVDTTTFITYDTAKYSVSSRYNTINIPLLYSAHFRWKKMSFGIEVGPVFHAIKQFNGTLYHDAPVGELPLGTPLSSYYEKWKVSLHTAARVDLQLTNRLTIYGSAWYRTSLKKFGTYVPHQPTSFGLGLGVSYTLGIR